MLRKILKTISRGWRLFWRYSPWIAGPLLGLAAFCPLYLFTLALSWLPHLLAIALLWVLALLIRKRPYKAGWLCAWMLLSSSVMVPLEPNQIGNIPEEGSQLKVAQINVLKFNGRHEQVLEQVKALEADLLSFQEVDQVWANSLVQALAQEYPFFSLAPMNNCYGMALFSKKPLEQVQLRFWEGYPAISAVVREGQQDTLILSLHAASPINRQRFRERNKQLKAAAELMRQAEGPALLIGDFNTVPWDPALRALMEEAKLKDSRARHYTATWPHFLGKWGIPIDYVMHSPHWERVNHRSVSIPGSDHKALVATLALKTLQKKHTSHDL